MTKYHIARLFLIAPLLISGCSSMSGLDASGSFSCKAAPGVNCQSISGVHQNASAGNLPFQRDELTATKTNDGEKVAYGSPKSDSKVSPRDMKAQYSGMPVRQPPLVLRVWMAPYEDDGGDLHDQAYFYTMVHSGKWMIEANRTSIANQFKPIYPLTRPSKVSEDPVPGEQVPLIQKGQYETQADRPAVQ